MLRYALIAALIVIGASAFLSIHYNDPEVMRRGGALLAAIAASMAILEAFLEHHVHIVEVAKPTEPNPFGTAPVSILRRVQQGRWRLEHKQLSDEKLRTVILISCIAIVGELLHGFGDIVILSLTNLVAFLRAHGA